MVSKSTQQTLTSAGGPGGWTTEALRQLPHLLRRTEGAASWKALPIPPPPFAALPAEVHAPNKWLFPPKHPDAMPSSRYKT